MKAKAKDPIDQGIELADYQTKRANRCKLLKKIQAMFPGNTEEQNEFYNNVMLAWERDYWQSIAQNTDLIGV